MRPTNARAAGRMFVLRCCNALEAPVRLSPACRQEVRLHCEEEGHAAGGVEEGHFRVWWVGLRDESDAFLSLV